MVRSSTSPPATRSSGSVNSAGLWLMPSRLGTKTMPVGQRRAIIWASCPAPDGSRLTECPRSAATAATVSTTRSSNTTGWNRASVRSATLTPSAVAAAATNPARSASASQRSASSVLRRSTVSVAVAATTLTRLGWSSRRPTVATWRPPIRTASWRTWVAMAAATYPGSCLRSIGVVPAWLDWPVMASSVHEIPWTPVTAPMVTPSASSTGPCSTWSSTKARGATPGHGEVPR